MAKQLSTARKFKMITGKDLFQQQKAMDTELKKEDGEITDLMEFVQYGLYFVHLIYYQYMFQYSLDNFRLLLH